MLPRFMHTVKAGQPFNLLWIQTAFLGDIVLTTGAMRLAAQVWPNCRQFLITTPIGAKALNGFPHLQGIIALDKKKQNMFSAFKGVKRQIANLGLQKAASATLQVHRSARSSLLSAYLGFPTLTYEESSLGFLASARVSRVPVLHECSRIALLLEPLGIPREKMQGLRPYLSPPSADTHLVGALADTHLNERALVGFAPGSVWGTKRWPVESFTALACALAEQTDCGLVLIGSGDEALLAAEMEKVLKEKGLGPGRFWNLAGKTSLDDLRALFPRLKLIVSNDSSPLHYASAFNVPSVALFGATVPEFGFTPLADHSVSLGVSGLNCRPCSDHGPMVCPKGHFRCMRDLKVEEVLKACLHRLAQ